MITSGPPPSISLPPNGLEKVDPKILEITLVLLAEIALVEELRKKLKDYYCMSDNYNPFIRERC